MGPTKSSGARLRTDALKALERQSGADGDLAAGAALLDKRAVPRWPLLLLLTTFGACSAVKSHPTSRLEWQKSSDLAPSLEGARQNCRVQTAAETLGTPQRPAVVDADFVKCMRAAGWMLLDHGTE